MGLEAKVAVQQTVINHLEKEKDWLIEKVNSLEEHIDSVERHNVDLIIKCVKEEIDEDTITYLLKTLTNT